MEFPTNLPNEPRFNLRCSRATGGSSCLDGGDRYDAGRGDRRGNARRRRNRQVRHRLGRRRTQCRFHRARRHPLENISNTHRINELFRRGQELLRAEMAAKRQAQFTPAAATAK
jgi:hypothetical protein